MIKKNLQAERRRGLLLSLTTLGLITALIVLPIQFRSTASINGQEDSQIEGQENLFSLWVQYPVSLLRLYNG